MHSREDELSHVLEGEFDVYAEDNSFRVETGECIFLPRFKPRAFMIRSPRLHLLSCSTRADWKKPFVESVRLPNALDD